MLEIVDIGVAQEALDFDRDSFTILLGGDRALIRTKIDVQPPYSERQPERIVCDRLPVGFQCGHNRIVINVLRGHWWSPRSRQ